MLPNDEQKFKEMLCTNLSTICKNYLGEGIFREPLKAIVLSERIIPVKLVPDEGRALHGDRDYVKSSFEVHLDLIGSGWIGKRKPIFVILGRRLLETPL